MDADKYFVLNPRLSASIRVYSFFSLLLEPLEGTQSKVFARHSEPHAIPADKVQRERSRSRPQAICTDATGNRGLFGGHGALRSSLAAVKEPVGAKPAGTKGPSRVIAHSGGGAPHHVYDAEGRALEGRFRYVDSGH